MYPYRNMGAIVIILILEHTKGGKNEKNNAAQ